MLEFVYYCNVTLSMYFPFKITKLGSAKIALLNPIHFSVDHEIGDAYNIL